jgi:hypothetical protein
VIVPGTYLDNPHDPLQEPDRRHRRCQFLLEHGWPPSSKDDAITRDAWWFRRDLQRCRNDAARQRLFRSYPALAQVHLFAQDTTRMQRAELEARLLANESDEYIAGRCNLSPAAVHQYHELYFEVRPYLQAQCYITNMAIGPKVHHGLTPNDHNVLLKLAGYTQGTGAVDRLLAYVADPPVWPAALTQLDDPALATFRERLLTQAWILSLTMPADASTAAKLLAIRSLLAQAGVLGKGSAGAENTPLSAVHATLDYRAFLCEPEAEALHAATPASTEVASSICEGVGSAVPCPREWQAVPA